MKTKLNTALRAWDRAQLDADSVESGIDAIGRIIREASLDAKEVPAAGRLLVAAAALIPLYIEFGTDPDGEASERLYEAASELGYKALE